MTKRSPLTSYARRLRDSRRLRWVIAAVVIMLLATVVFVNVCIPTTAHAGCLARTRGCDAYLGFTADEYRCGSFFYGVLCWRAARNDPTNYW